MNHLIYLVYGGENYNNEALFSLLSYYKFHTEDENKVIIYTDDVAFFKSRISTPITFIQLTTEQLKKWRGNINYIHRSKIKLLQDVANRFQGNFLYVDTDTIFNKNCADLFNKIKNGVLLLDRCEGSLADNPGGIARKMRKFLKTKNQFRLPSYNDTIELDDTFKVWNSGSVGFNSAYAKQLVLIEELIDELFSNFDLFIMEQIAVSYFFQKAEQMEETQDYIHHYWYFKEFRPVLKHFFSHNTNKSLAEIQNETGKIDPRILSEEKRAYKKMSFWQKQRHKIIARKKWDVSVYEL